MAGVSLRLGDVTFADAEIPEHIAVSTGHRAAVHKLVGGARVVDMLGADHEPIEWSGWLTGSNALSRAIQLKAMNDAGLTVTLSWSQFLYKVVITGFVADYQRDYQIPYRITCGVIQDMVGAKQSGAGSSIDSLIGGDFSIASSLSSAIGDSGISSTISTLGSAISTVSNFATAAKSAINSVLQPIAAARAQVQTLIASTENTLKSVTTLGGILPNNPLAKQVASISNQVNAFTTQKNLVQLDSVLGRMSSNIGQLNSGVKTIQVTGGNLYDLASKFYGKVSGWTALAQANPQLKGETNITSPTTISVPPYTNDSGGVPNG